MASVSSSSLEESLNLDNNGSSDSESIRSSARTVVLGASICLPMFFGAGRQSLKTAPRFCIAAVPASYRSFDSSIAEFHVAT
jgi:hypothetical protein